MRDTKSSVSRQHYIDTGEYLEVGALDHDWASYGAGKVLDSPEHRDSRIEVCVLCGSVRDSSGTGEVCDART